VRRRFARLGCLRPTAAGGRRRLCRQRPAEIAHVKLFINRPGAEGSIAGNLTGTASALDIRGALAGAPQVTMVLNARVHVAPAALRDIIEQALRQAGQPDVRFELANVKNFAPARPQPTHHMDKVV